MTAHETAETVGIDPDGVGGYAYRATPDLDAAVRIVMAQIRAFDYADGALARDAALPWRIAAYRPDGALPIDVWAAGFVHGNGSGPAPTEGLTRARSGSCWLPTDDTAGGKWRAILERWNTRPRLTDTLAAHNVPVVQVDPDSRVVRRIIAALYDDDGGTDRLALWSPGVPMPPDAALTPATLGWFATLVRGGSTDAVESPSEIARVVILR